MAITRVGVGTVTDKTGALTLTITGISMNYGDLLTVELVYDVGVSAPDNVKWGQRIVKPRQTTAGNNVVSRIASLIYTGASSRTRNLVATWVTTAPTAKTMIASVFSSSGILMDVIGVPDVTAGQSQAATTAPNSGTAVLTNYDDMVLLGLFGSEGPSSDTIGTVGNGWSSGQRAGTVGVPPASNITGHEVYKIITTAESAQASKTGATARNFTTVMATFREVDPAGKGVSTESFQNVGEIFENANLDLGNMAFQHNLELDRIEAYDISGPTLVAYYTDAGWVTV